MSLKNKSKFYTVKVKKKILVTKSKPKIKRLSDWYTYTMISIQYSGRYKPEFLYEVGVFALNIIKEIQNGLL